MANTMKLFAFDNSNLMEVLKIYSDGNNLVVEGTIMGAMPIRAILKPEEVRKASKMMSGKTKFHAAKILLRR